MDGFSAAELEVLDWIAQHLRTDLLDSIMPWISRLADSGGIWLLLGILLLALNRKERRVGAQVLLSMLLSLLFCNLILKNVVGRLRPFVLNPLAELLIAAPGDASFPSGHSSISFAAAAVLLLNGSKGRWAAMVLAALIAFSRLYLYVHFPSDVVGGTALGIVCALLSRRIWERFSERTWRRPDRRLPGGGTKP